MSLSGCMEGVVERARRKRAAQIPRIERGAAEVPSPRRGASVVDGRHAPATAPDHVS
jgi:hypothetical protein